MNKDQNTISTMRKKLFFKYLSIQLITFAVLSAFLISSLLTGAVFAGEPLLTTVNPSIQEEEPTAGPSPTDTLEPTPTDTPEPMPTDTPEPTPSETPGGQEQNPSPLHFPLLLNRLFFPPATEPERVLVCSSLDALVPIPDNTPDGVRHTLTFPHSGYLHDLDIYLNINHPWVGDLAISLLHEETGVEVKLIDRPGYPASNSGCSGDNIITILDDEASQPVETKCASSIPTLSGSFQPEEPLQLFNSLPMYGSWTLVAADMQEADSGRLVKWCLEAAFSSQPPAPPEPSEPQVLPSSARIYNISGVNQALPLDCESRSAVDWAAYFGVNIGELEFFNRLPKSDDPDVGFVGNVFGTWGQIPPNPYGVHSAPVAQLLREYGVEAYAQRGAAWDKVREEIASGRPVMVWVIGSSNGVLPGRFFPVYYTSSTGNTTVVSSYQHTAIVIGYTENQVTLLDGSKIYTRTLSQFLDSWSVLRNMAVMAVP
jgi:uncharacterized protein YvpB